jgi:uncharacterized SAM-binding protein YcdF (DUF218 family)
VIAFAKALLLPPAGPVLIGLVGVLWLPRNRNVGTRLLLCGVLSSYLLSVGVTAHLLAKAVQTAEPLTAEALRAGQPDIIVVLGGGVYPEAPEYGGATVHLRTLGRLRYAAYLSRHIGLRVLASGGTWEAENGVRGLPEAELMRQVLEQEFGIREVTTETRSRNTRENARYSATMLRELGLDTILLVTQAAHMPRAVMLFEHCGIKVVPAPTLFFPGEPGFLSWSSWVPSAASSQAIYYLSHEALGLIWDGWWVFRGN